MLISTADWDNPYWTNKQHVTRELGRLGHRVLYIESQGLRRPTATARDAKRIFRRLARALRGPKQVEQGVWVWSPLVIPFQGSVALRRLNRLLLRAGIAVCCRFIGLRPSVLWTYSPLTTELFATDGYDLLVYHAVDDVKSQPGMPTELIARAENDLAARADLIFVTAPHLLSVLAALNRRTYFFPNVADFDHFNTALSPGTVLPDDVASIPEPRIGFIGAVSTYKLDFSLIREVALRRPQWSIVVIGEVGEGDPWTDISGLKSVPNVHLLGGRSYASLPGYLKSFNVAILPNRLNDYTRSMFPMKFFEYLAAGRPIVSTELRALADYSHLATFAESSDAFIAGIESGLLHGSDSLSERLAAARVHTYATRTAKMLEIVEVARNLKVKSRR